MSLKLRVVSVGSILALLLAACGSVATPRYEADAIIAEANREATEIVAAARADAGQAEATAEVDPVVDVAEVTSEPEVSAPAEDATNTPRARFEEVIVEPEATEAPAETEEVTAMPSATLVPPTATTVPPTATSIPPTNTVMPSATPVPPTNTPLPEPTTASTEAPTEAEAQAPADDAQEEASAGSANQAEEDRLELVVSLASVDNGEALFNGGAVPACTTCHLPNSEERLVGPGMLNVFERAGERVEGEGPYEYLYNSIRNSQDFIVPDYPPGGMINYTEDLLTDAQIFDLIAYLITLSDG